MPIEKEQAEEIRAWIKECVEDALANEPKWTPEEREAIRTAVKTVNWLAVTGSVSKTISGVFFGVAGIVGIIFGFWQVVGQWLSK